MREFFRQPVWSPEFDAQRGEEEEITEENVYDSYDETIPFFPDQILIEEYFCVLLLLIVTALSYLVPASLPEPADTATIAYVPRPEWFFFFYEQMLMFFPGYALISFGAVVVPTIFIVLLQAVPWLDRQPDHDTRRRALGMLLLSGIDAASSYGSIWPALVLAGLGLAPATPALVAAATGSVPPERAGMASAVNNTARQGAGAFGVAILGGFLGTRTSLVVGVDLALAVGGIVLLLGGLLALALIRPRSSSRGDSRLHQARGE